MSAAPPPPTGSYISPRIQSERIKLATRISHLRPRYESYAVQGAWTDGGSTVRASSDSDARIQRWALVGHHATRLGAGGELIQTFPERDAALAERYTLTRRDDIARFCVRLEAGMRYPLHDLTTLEDGSVATSAINAALLIADRFGGRTVSSPPASAAVSWRRAGAALDFALIDEDRWLVDWKTAMFFSSTFTDRFVYDLAQTTERNRIESRYGAMSAWRPATRQPEPRASVAVYHRRSGGRGSEALPMSEFDPSLFTKVAEVAGDNLPDARSLTTDSALPWCRGHDLRLRVLTACARSTANGDVLEMAGQRFVVRGQDFLPVPTVAPAAPAAPEMVAAPLPSPRPRWRWSLSLALVSDLFFSGGGNGP